MDSVHALGTQHPRYDTQPSLSIKKGTTEEKLKTWLRGVIPEVAEVEPPRHLLVLVEPRAVFRQVRLRSPLQHVLT